MRLLIVAWLCLTSTMPALADDEPTSDVDAALIRVREHFARGQFEAAKQLLLSTYESTKRADLLFALGQAEYNLGRFKQAIEYYEQFLATNPTVDAASLAHQAIGSARARLDTPVVVVEPPRTPPLTPTLLPRVRRWDGVDTVLAIAGVATVAVGGGLFGAGYRDRDDRSGSLADYDRRIDRSLSWQRAGGALAIGGVVLVGVALVRWNFLRVEVSPPTSSTGTIGLAARGRW